MNGSTWFYYAKWNVNQRKTNTISFDFYVESKENKWMNKIEGDTQIQRRELWLPECRGFERLSEKDEGIKENKLTATK